MLRDSLALHPGKFVDHFAIMNRINDVDKGLHLSVDDAGRGEADIKCSFFPGPSF